MSFSNIRPFYTKIISHDKSCYPIEYNTSSDYCIYNAFDNDNKTQHVITLANKQFKYNYVVNQKNIFSYVQNIDTVYSGEIDIYMNNIILTEVWTRFLKPNSKIFKIPLCLYIDNPWNENFAHLIFELLYPLIKLNEINGDLPILMSVGSYTLPLLKILGVNNPIIKREENHVYRIENSVYFKSLGVIEKKTTTYVKKYINNKLDYLKHEFIKPIGVIIYRTEKRIIYNYQDFIDRLILTFTNIEWIIYKDDECFDQYFPKFVNCSYIIGPHGAGHANMIFSQQPNVKVFEFMIKGYLNPCFKNLADMLNYEFHTMFIDNDANYNTVLNIDEIIDSVMPYLIK
jgi:hypothetical protein